MHTEEETMMEKTKRRTLVLFDVGGVLLKIEFSRFYEEAARLSQHLSPHDFKKAYLSSNLEVDFLSGRIKTADYMNQLRTIISPGKSIPKEELLRVVSYCWKEPMYDMIELKRKVYESGCCVGIFSNMSELGYKVISEMNPEMFETFDPSSPLILSFQVGSMKPKPEMYRKVSGYDKVILIDDNELYVRKGVEDFGWCGISFTPFIDKAEASRPVSRDKGKPSGNLRIANSIEEVVESLKYFGVKL